jgi:hypothetical protein
VENNALQLYEKQTEYPAAWLQKLISTGKPMLKCGATKSHAEVE